MSEESVIRVNFGKPVPLFPLGSVVLLPHGLLPLHIFEQRYRRMVEDVLESTGQIAMAVYAGHAGRGGEEAGRSRPALRPGVCLGRVFDYQRLPDGRFNIALQGVCRARIKQELPQAPECPYRQAMLEPVGLEEPDEKTLTATRLRLADMLEQEPLSQLKDSSALLEHVHKKEIPTSVILELIAITFISDPEVKYKILEGEHARARGRLIERELLSLARLLRMAEPQRKVEWPKGCSWN